MPLFQPATSWQFFRPWKITFQYIRLFQIMIIRHLFKQIFQVFISIRDQITVEIFQQFFCYITTPGISFRKSVAPHARKMRSASSAKRFIITVSWSEEVSRAYRIGNHLEYRASIPENKSSDDCRYDSCGLTDEDMNSMDLQLLQKL